MVRDALIACESAKCGAKLNMMDGTFIMFLPESFNTMRMIDRIRGRMPGDVERIVMLVDIRSVELVEQSDVLG